MFNPYPCFKKPILSGFSSLLSQFVKGVASRGEDRPSNGSVLKLFLEIIVEKEGVQLGLIEGLVREVVQAIIMLDRHLTRHQMR
jgi:hypothetical protein